MPAPPYPSRWGRICTAPPSSGRWGCPGVVARLSARSPGRPGSALTSCITSACRRTGYALEKGSRTAWTLQGRAEKSRRRSQRWPRSASPPMAGWAAGLSKTGVGSLSEIVGAMVKDHIPVGLALNRNRVRGQRPPRRPRRTTSTENAQSGGVVRRAAKLRTAAPALDVDVSLQGSGSVD